jgi:hypothetical protein
MSLEESMSALAESNLKLAKSFDNYAAVVTKFGLKIESDNEGKASKPAAKTSDDDGDDEPKKKPGRPAGSGKAAKTEEVKAKPKKPSDDFDDDADSDDAPTYEAVKDALMELKNAAGDKQPALDVIGKFGYDTLGEVQGNEKDYAKILAAAQKAIKKYE